LNVAAATFTGAAAATIAVASVAAVSVAEETGNCMGKKSIITKMLLLQQQQ
jgi:L-lactate permease